MIVDSFRSVMQAAQRQNGRLDLQHFVQELGMRLTGWQATTFLVGEFQLAETDDHPVFTVADGLVWLYQSLDRNSMVRKMQVMKMRGQAPIPGLHTFRITDHGIQVFPRLISGPPEPPPVGGAGKTEAPTATAVRGGDRVSTRCWVAAFRPDTPCSSPDRRDRARASSPPSSSAKASVAANRASLRCSKSARANTHRPAPSVLTRPFAMARWASSTRARSISRSTRRCTS